VSFIGMGNVRMMFTVVDSNDEEHDVILHAESATQVSQIADLLARDLGGSSAAEGGSPRLYAGQTRVDHGLSLVGSPLRDGCRIGLNRPLDEPAVPSGQPKDAEATISLAPSDDGNGLIFHRPPRLRPGRPLGNFPLPPRPIAPGSRGYLPAAAAGLFTILASAVSGILVGGAYGYKAVAVAVVVAIAVVGSSAMVAWYLAARHQYRRMLSAHQEQRKRIEEAARRARDAEQIRLRTGYPDPATLADIASGTGRRLWERRRSDPDYLELRIGTADLMSSVSLSDPAGGDGGKSFLPIDAVPATVRLTNCGVLGVAGSDSATRAAGRWLIAQIAVLRSPADVRVCLLTDPSAQDDWLWLRWLPHFRSRQESAGPVRVGNDLGTVSARIAELLALIENRRGANRQDSGDVVVIFDGWGRFRTLPGVSRILREGKEAGVFAICLDTSERLLPAECEAVIASDDAGQRELRVRQAGREEIRGAGPDLVGPAWCEDLARALAPLMDADALAQRGLPETSRLLDVLRLDPPVPEEITSRWGENAGTTSAVIGASSDGPFSMDLRRDGPHGLIAGTTGSGKSELLQTIVASFAAASPPDAITFLLIDYKGGSAFKDCGDLPHTVGVIVDFDPHEAERVLNSLAAELRRREFLLAETGAKDIDDYAFLRVRQPGPGPQPLPRLVIVVDEFAAMVRDLPDLVPGLVDIAQRGRSLGIHLILATQRPAGVVSPAIRANTNLRIALRVIDSTESTDVIDAPDAASIPRYLPGRGYVRLLDGTLIPVQTSRVGGLAPSSHASPLAHAGRLEEPGQAGAAAIAGTIPGRTGHRSEGARRRRCAGERIAAPAASAPAMATRAARRGAAE
jgi:S-DNA-T family DNA segregation ATPase FtsK/SpoIIIE